MKIHLGTQITDAVLGLLDKYQIARTQDIFDAVVVATMIANGVRKICSYDTAQFSRFSEIEVLRPTT